MKVLILIDLNPFYVSSASTNRWRTLIEGLAEIGVKIELLITGGFSNPDEFRKRNVELNNNIKISYYNFLFHHNLWLRRINRYLIGSIIFNLIVKWRVIFTIRKNKDSILWLSNNLEHFKLLSTLKKKIPGIKSFFEISEFPDVHNLNKGNILQKSLDDKRKIYFEKKTIHELLGMAVMTKTLYRYFNSMPEPKPKLIHLPMTVDLERFQKIPEMRSDLIKPYIAFIGVMNNQKEGIDILIDAFANIVKDFPDYKLYMFGFYHYDTPGHTKKIKELRLEDKIFYKGEVTRDEIPQIIMNADLLVLPRPDSRQAQGGFPTKLGEYLASGKPVCVTKVGEIPYYLKEGESVFFAEPGSIQSFAQAMRRALNDKNNALRVGLKGREAAEKYFNQKIQAQTLYNFLRDL